MQFRGFSSEAAFPMKIISKHADVQKWVSYNGKLIDRLTDRQTSKCMLWIPSARTVGCQGPEGKPFCHHGIHLLLHFPLEIKMAHPYWPFARP